MFRSRVGLILWLLIPGGACDQDGKGDEVDADSSGLTEEEQFRARAEACAQYTDQEEPCRDNGCAPYSARMLHLDGESCELEDVELCLFSGPPGRALGGPDAPDAYLRIDDSTRGIDVISSINPESLIGYGEFRYCTDADVEAGNSCMCGHPPL